MRKTMMALVMIGALAGCVSKKRFDELALQQQQLSEQKDSLVADVLATTSMMTEINADLAAVRGLGVSPASTSDRPLTGKAEDRSIMLGKIREVISRLDAAEKQVAAQKTRINTLATSQTELQGERTKLAAQLDSLSKTLEDMKTAAMQQEATISQQKAQIQSLSARTDTLVQQTAQLTTERAAVTDTLTHVVNEENTVYYAVGTKDELIKRGILVDEGSKFLVFGGKTLQPARELKPELFQRLDRRRDTMLTVPEPTKEYKIVTRQDPKFLGAGLQPDGKIKGDLHISSPDFWDAGKFLILVRD